MKPTVVHRFVAIVALANVTVQIVHGRVASPADKRAWDPSGVDNYCVDEGLHSDERDCNKYVRCELKAGQYIAWAMACPPNLAFNPITKSCDWPENVASCSITDPPATAAHRKATKVCLKRGLNRDPHDCTKYYDCGESDDYSHLSCRSGTAFNSITDECDWPENVEECK